MYDIFISYATKDGLKLAKGIKQKFKDERSLNAFVKNDEMGFGKAADGQIDAAIEECEFFILILTTGACNSEYVLGETETARRLKKTIIPCKEKDVDPMEFPIPLRNKDYLNFESCEDLWSKLKNENFGITVVIPAGGKGANMHPLSTGMPKQAFFIGTKPMICRIVHKLDRKLFSNIIITSTPRFAHLIKSCTDKCTKIPIECKPVTKKDPAKLKDLELKRTFLLHFSDILLCSDVDWSDFVEYHKRIVKKDPDVIGTLMVSELYKLSVGLVTAVHAGQDTMLTDIEEKPDMQAVGKYINMAVSIFEPEFLKYVDDDEYDCIYGDSIPRAIENGEKFALHPHEEWKHVQTLSDYYDIQKGYFSDLD